jgi:RND family efflux transporter MFP subunit
MRPTPKKTSMAVGLALLAATAIALAWWQWPVPVETTRPIRGPAIEAVYATGTAEPTVMVPVAPRVGGRLLSIEVEEGQEVRGGQLLARIESADLDQTVHEMRAREQLARAQHERSRRLAAQNFVSEAEVDRTRSELQAAQAAARRAQAQRDYNQLVAPADGLVLRRDGEAGQFVPAGQAVFTLACCAPLRVTAEVDEEDIARVRIGQPVSLRGDALPGQLFEGEVAEITPKGDPVQRSYRVRIRLKDAPAVAQGPLRSGMTLDANIVVARRENALLLPNRTLQGNAAWVLAAGGRLHRRQVQKGAAGSERTEILSGIGEGDSVVLAPGESLRDGQRARALH